MEIYNTTNPIFFGIPHDDVQACDTTTVLTALNSFLETQERVAWGRGRITLIFEGFDDDPRDVWNIPEIRRYIEKLDEQFPYWFYFADLDAHTLKVLALCLCRVVKVGNGSTPDPEDLKHFLASHVIALNILCDRFDLGDEIKEEITKQVCEHLVPVG
jgi:hypothetical protein